MIRSQPAWLGIPLWDYDKNQAKEIYVRADVPFHGMFVSATFEATPVKGITSSIGKPFTCVFESGHDYEIIFRLDEKPLDFFEIVSTEGATVRKEVRQLVPKDIEPSRKAFEKSAYIKILAAVAGGSARNRQRAVSRCIKAFSSA